MRVALVCDAALHTHRRTEAVHLEPDCDCGIHATQSTPSHIRLPTSYSLELTPMCNNRCPGCSNVFIKDPRSRWLQPGRSAMPRDMWQRILEQIAPHAHHVKLTGGESTHHPQFELLVRDVQQYQVPFTVFTNGRWKHPEHFVSWLSDIPHCAGLLISLHGVDAATHEAFTGVSRSFAETTKNIRRATQAGLCVYVNTVLTRQNVNQIEQLVDFALSLGVQCVVFNRYIGHPIPAINLPGGDLKRAMRDVDRIGKSGKRTKIGTCVPLCFVESSSIGCAAGVSYCTIDPWGNVRPCNHAPQIVGNLLNGSLEHIWQSPAMQSWRSMVPDACRTCSVFRMCHSGCRADAVLKRLPHDPLMTRPIHDDVPALHSQPHELCLYDRATLHMMYTLSKDLSGTVLTDGRDKIPISDQTTILLESIDRTATLRQIQSDFGEEAIECIGDLYDRGAISLHW